MSRAFDQMTIEAAQEAIRCQYNNINQDKDIDEISYLAGYVNALEIITDAIRDKLPLDMLIPVLAKSIAGMVIESENRKGIEHK